MKNFILYITLCFSIVCTAQTTKYGAGVTHTEAPPQYVPNYAVNPSLLAYDSTEQAIYVNSKIHGWWKLFSPFERYVRTFTNINFANGQIFTWSNIEAFITSSAGGSGMKKNGYYIVKFTANATGTDVASVDFTNILIQVPNNPIPVSNNDYFLVRYYRDKLISLSWINDKQNVSFQIINNQVDFHTRQIDSLKARLDTLNVTPSVSSKVDTFFKKYYQYIPFPQKNCNDTLRYVPHPLQSNNFFAVPPAMIGDTLVGFYASICQPSNNILQLRFCRINRNDGVQYYIRYNESNLEPYQKNKFFDKFFSVEGSILQADDRIFCDFLGYLQYNQPNLEGQGLSITIVVKPKLR